METTFDAVILANGDFPTHDIPLSVLRQAAYLVCCDGAAIPEADAVVGDGDSVAAEYRQRLIRISEQEDNDLTKATRYCLSHLDSIRRQASASQPSTAPSIAYLGCTGKREDHTLGNISLMVRYLRDWGIAPTMLTDHGTFVPAHGSHTFDAVAGQQVSILNFGCSRLQSQGLKWDSYAYGEWWQGTLNEAVTNQFTITADGYYLVYRTY